MSRMAVNEKTSEKAIARYSKSVIGCFALSN